MRENTILNFIKLYYIIKLLLILLNSILKYSHPPKQLFEYLALYTVGIARSIWGLGYGLDFRGVGILFSESVGIFLLPTKLRLTETHAVPSAMCTGTVSEKIKRPRSENYHSFVPIVEVDNAWSCKSFLIGLN